MRPSRSGARWRRRSRRSVVPSGYPTREQAILNKLPRSFIQPNGLGGFTWGRKGHAYRSYGRGGTLHRWPSQDRKTK